MSDEVKAILEAWRKTLREYTPVKSKYDSEIGMILSVGSTFPIYDFDVLFKDGISHCKAASLYPVWWPLPME